MDEFPATESPPRCLQCHYVLRGLPEPRCPECGRFFDPGDPLSYPVKPPLVFWRYWLPPLVMTAAACAIWALLYRTAGVGVAATVITPFALGGLVGYATRPFGKWLLIFVGIITLFVSMGFMVSAGLQGIYCGLILVGIALVPLMVGLAAGVALRTILKRSGFSQRWHLPVWLFLALPLVWARLEGPVSFRYGEVR